MTAPVRIAVTMTCHNRRETTLRCLRSLMPQQSERVTFEVWLVDDGSTDGTGPAVRGEFPQVRVLAGTGNLFWSRGMHRAMTAAMQLPFDFILWLNDDVVLHPDAVANALADYREAAAADPRQIVVGATIDPHTGAITYSGFMRTHGRDPSKLRRLDPDAGQLRRCDTMNGNFVLIPRELIDTLGPVDPAFVHQLGDIDYGYRAAAHGAGIWIGRQPVGECCANRRQMPFRQRGLTPMQRWRALDSPLGLPLRPWLTFMWRHGGAAGLLRLFLIYAARMVGR